MSRDKYDAIGPSDCNAPWGEWVLAYETAIHQGKIPGSSIDHLPQEDQERVVACRHAVDALREVFGRREDANDEARSVIGDFRVIRELGRGGMGTVFEVEQISMGRRVALKVLPFASLAPDKALQRFRNEVRAVAALDHPHIVSVYSVGEERGVHYFSMQLVRGRTLADLITELRGKLSLAFVGKREAVGNDAPTIDTETTGPRSTTQQDEQAALSTVVDSRQTANRFRQIAELGIQAADALQHAHDQGVLHRDVKPANLMLDDQGKLYVTDFGLARIETEAGVTTTGDIVGTLRYMAPEQALGKRVIVDHRADIYSLGATLYELVSLRPAFSAPDRSELLKLIAFEEPRPLRKLDRRIPVELETIVGKAMEKSPDERYGTAQDLARDLQSFLEHRPLKAKPITPVRRIAKWSRRNTGAVWTAAGVLSLLIAGLAVNNVTIWREQQRTEFALAEAEKQRETARQRAEEADAVVDFLVEDLLNVDDELLEGGDVSLKQALNAAEGRIASTFDEQPHVESAVRRAIGVTYRNLGNYEAAERHLSRAVELCEAVHGANHEQTIESKFEHARALRTLGKSTEAQTILEDILPRCRRVLGRAHKTTLIAATALASLLAEHGEVDKGKSMLDDVLDMAERVYGPEDFSTLNATRELAGLLGDLESFEDTHELHHKFLAQSLRAFGERSPNALAASNQMAVNALNHGKLEMARELFEENLQVVRDVLGTEHPNTLMSVANLATTLERQGETAKAEQLYNEVLVKQQRILGPDHPNALSTMVAQATLLFNRGDLKRSEQILQEVLEKNRLLRGPGNPETLATATRLAAVLQRLGKRQEARKLLEESHRAQARIFGREHLETLTTAIWLAKTLVGLGEFEQARSLYEETLDIQRQLLSPEDNDVLSTLELLGTCLSAEGRWQEADNLFLEGLEVARRNFGEADHRTFSLRAECGAMAGLQGRWQEAATHIAPCLSAHGTDTVDAEWCYLAYAPVLVRLGDMSAYRSVCKRAAELYADAKDPRTAERICRACLLAPAGGELLASLERMREVLELGQRKWEPAEDYYKPWGMVALALLEYRGHNWERSLDWCQEALEQSRQRFDTELVTNRSRVIYPHAMEVPRDAATTLIMAMNYEQLDESDVAKAELRKVETLLDDVWSAPGNGRTTQNWAEWEFAAILRDEARREIGQQAAVINLSN